MPPKKMGRPPVDNPKDTTFRVRIDEVTKDKLESAAESLAVSRSEVVRLGINLVYDSLKK